MKSISCTLNIAMSNLQVPIVRKLKKQEKLERHENKKTS
jgi:hypothetical protein